MLYLHIIIGDHCLLEPPADGLQKEQVFSTRSVDNPGNKQLIYILVQLWFQCRITLMLLPAGIARVDLLAIILRTRLP